MKKIVSILLSLIMLFSTSINAFAVGLSRLPIINDESFENCLMGYSNYTMTAPAIPDMQGAAVISGVHTSHSLVEYGKYNTTSHRKHCEDCNAYTLYAHTYSGNVCTKCGFDKVKGY